MVKKTITYTNQFTEETVTEDHYFNISKADLIEMEMEMEEQGLRYTAKDGTQHTGMAAYLQRITEAEDAPEAYKWIKKILRRAYLKRVDDKPVKSPEIWAEFENSEAYSELVWGLFTDPEELARFIQATFPGNLEQIASEVLAKAEQLKESQNGSTPEKDPTGLTERVTSQVLTQTQVEEMDADELKTGLATGKYKLPS